MHNIRTMYTCSFDVISFFYCYLFPYRDVQPLDQKDLLLLLQRHALILYYKKCSVIYNILFLFIFLFKYFKFFYNTLYYMEYTVNTIKEFIIKNYTFVKSTNNVSTILNNN